MTAKEPRAARLHFMPRVLIRYPQRVLVRLLRPYLERAPGWVLLRTRGRKTGLPREVLLPCQRFGRSLFVISTHGGRSDWIRNIIHRTILRPIWVPFLRWRVTGRPVVVIRPASG